MGRDPFWGLGVYKLGSWGIPNMKKKYCYFKHNRKINEIWQSDDDNLIYNGAYEDLSLYLGRKNCNASNNNIFLSYCAGPLSGFNALFN